MLGEGEDIYTIGILCHAVHCIMAPIGWRSGICTCSATQTNCAILQARVQDPIPKIDDGIIL